MEYFQENFCSVYTIECFCIFQVIQFIRSAREMHSGELVLVVRPNGQSTCLLMLFTLFTCVVYLCCLLVTVNITLIIAVEYFKGWL